MRIVQLIPTITPGDAVSNDALCMHRALLAFDPKTHIYAEMLARELGDVVSDVSKLPELGEDDVLIYHMSIGSPCSLRIDELPCRKVMIYHNITPAEYFAPYNALFTSACRRGRAELVRMRDWFDYAIADSDFNRRDLLAAGYTCPIDVCPVMVPQEDYERTPEERWMKKYGDGRTNILFVGRVAPNKKQENVIRAFAAYQKKYDPEARLQLVGLIGLLEPYAKRLKAYARSLGARNVRLTDHIPFESVLAYYRTASVFLCMSEHEGFCVPLLEAMHFDVPIVALSAAAVPETLGGSGLLLEDNDPDRCAELLHRVMTEAELRSSMLEKQRERLGELSVERVQSRFASLLRAFLAAPQEKRKTRIVQLLPSLSRGDAVSRDVLALDRVLDTLPCRHDIWALQCSDELLAASVRCGENAPALQKDDIAVYHMAMGEPMAERFAALPCRKLLIYHNITPAEYIEPYNPAMAAACRKGLRQTEKLLSRVDRAVGDSEYNCAALSSLGGNGAEVLPLVIDWSEYDAPVEPERLRRFRDGRHNILFVGRAAPNKRLEKVVRAFAAYRELYDAEARLLFAGSEADFGSYAARVRSYARALAGDSVLFLGKVSGEELIALYRTADAYLSMSEHEGFGVPLAEAMYFDVPVVARAAAAVPETMGNAGVLLESDDPVSAAEALHRVIADADCRESVLSAQRERLRAFSYEKTSERARAFFAELLGADNEG